jgi:2-keto-3-deoxy-galactonokinase
MLTPPLFVADGLDVLIFGSAGEAARFIEARDAVSGALIGWDASGRRLRFDVDDAVCLDAARVMVRGLEPNVLDATGLQARLRAVLDALDAPLAEHATLAQAVERAIARLGYVK